MVFDKVRETLANYKEIDASGITMETTLEELELDSLDTVELVMELEEAFDMQIELTDPVENVGGLVALIERNQ